MNKIREGKERKDGINPRPTTPKPFIKPPPQGSRLLENKEPILGCNVRSFLEQLTQRLPPWDKERHNLTVDEDGDMVLTIKIGEFFWPCKLSDEDLLKSVDELADEIEKMIKAKYASFVPATGDNL